MTDVIETALQKLREKNYLFQRKKNIGDGVGLYFLGEMINF